MTPSPSALDGSLLDATSDDALTPAPSIRVPPAALGTLMAAIIAIGWLSARAVVTDENLRILGGALAIVMPALLGCWLGVGVLARRDLVRADRTGWLFTGLGAGSGCIFAMCVLLPRGAADAGLTPAIGAAAHIIMLVLGTAGVLHWVRRISPAATIGTVLDLACVAVLAYVVTWRTILSSAIVGTATTDGYIDTITLYTTPALGTLLLVAVVTVLSQVGRQDLRGSELLATFGIGAVVASDLGMALRGIDAGGLDDAWHQAVVGGEGGVSVVLGWVLGMAGIAFAASLRRAAPESGTHVPLIERSATWELLVSLVPFALLGVVLTSVATSDGGGNISSRGVLATLGCILLARCALVAVNAIRASRTSDTDHLTSALSHRQFQERLPLLLEDALIARQDLSLVVVDVDDFGLFNDVASHAHGDRYLRELAWTIRNELGEGDLLFRIGGDDFAIVTPTTAKEAVALADRFCSAARAIKQISTTIPLTLTVGIASVPEYADDAHELVHLATGTLYWGKLNGKATITAYDPDVVKVLSAEERMKAMEEGARLRAVLALARALDARDAYTARHSENVSRYAIAIAGQLGWGVERLELLRMAGLLHDVGKIGVRDATLRKATQLTNSEWHEMQQHPVLGARMIAGVAPEEVVPWVVSHHERPDGRGYPHGLVGDAIPEGARVLAVADTFDAMTSSRSYRKALSPLKAIEVLAAGAGTQFDAASVRGFMQAVQEGAIDLVEVERTGQAAFAQEVHDADLIAELHAADAVHLEVDPEFQHPVEAVRPMVPVEVYAPEPVAQPQSHAQAQPQQAQPQLAQPQAVPHPVHHAQPHAVPHAHPHAVPHATPQAAPHAQPHAVPGSPALPAMAPQAAAPAAPGHGWTAPHAIPHQPQLAAGAPVPPAHPGALQHAHAAGPAAAPAPHGVATDAPVAYTGPTAVPSPHAIPTPYGQPAVPPAHALPAPYGQPAAPPVPPADPAGEWQMPTAA